MYMRWTTYFSLHRWLLPLAVLAVSCSKNEEPPKPVGSAVEYPGGATQTLRQMVDSIGDLRIYDSIYHHSDLAHTLDSLRAAGAGQLFTLFAPSDQAFQRAGITLSQVGTMAPAVLDSIVFYLSIPGYYSAQALSELQGYQPLNSLLEVSQIQSAYAGEPWQPGNGYSQNNPYIYTLTVGWTNGGVMLNGTPGAAAGAQGVAATDGVLWEVDTVVTKPTQEAYAVIASDTSFSLYMAACRINDSIYENNYVSFNNPIAVSYTSDPDTVDMEMMQGVAQRTYFIPTNDAFRRAGMASVADIYAYIFNSVVVISGNFYDQYYNTMATNLDSVFRLHQTRGVLFTQDMLNDPSLNRLAENPSGVGQNGEYPYYWGVSLTNVSGQVVLHRQDYPGGRASMVIAPKDIVTLNGVVHSVDNLLIPQP